MAIKWELDPETKKINRKRRERKRERERERERESLSLSLSLSLFRAQEGGKSIPPRYNEMQLRTGK